MTARNLAAVIIIAAIAAAAAAWMVTAATTPACPPRYHPVIAMHQASHKTYECEAS